MPALFERARPRTWSDVIGQEKAVAKLASLRQRTGLSGRAYWISGASGTGKTTIAKLIAAECAEPFAVCEIDGEEATPDICAAMLRDCNYRPIGAGSVYIINEAHGMKAGVIRRLLVVLEALAPWVTVIFTTLSEATEDMLADKMDAKPLLSRCTILPLSRRGLAESFAERLAAIATEEGLGAPTVEQCVKLLKEVNNNFRAALNRIENGEFLAA
jgi:replication-associated recombination protein RarA